MLAVMLHRPSPIRTLHCRTCDCSRSATASAFASSTPAAGSRIDLLELAAFVHVAGDRFQHPAHHLVQERRPADVPKRDVICCD